MALTDRWDLMHTLLVACYGFGFLLCSLLILAGVHYIWILENNPPELKRVKVYSFWALGLFALTCIIRFIENLFYYNIDPADNLYKGICENLALFFWACAQSCSYKLFVARFKIIFNGTKYQFHNNRFLMLYFFIIMFVICIFGNIAVAQIYYQGVIDESLFLLIDGINNGVASILDLILTIIFIYLFIKTLFDLSVDVALNNKGYKSSMHSIPQDRMSSLISLNSDQISIVHLVAKCTILSITAVMSTQIFFLFYNIMYLYIIISGNDSLYNILFDIYLLLWWFAIMMNSISIFLNLDATIGWYHFFCVKFHNLCQKCCTRQAKQKLKVKKVRNHRMGSINDNGNLLICNDINSNYSLSGQRSFARE